MATISPKERIAIALQKKDEGNCLFKEDQYIPDTASKESQRDKRESSSNSGITSMLGGKEKLTEDEEKQIITLYVSVYSNMAACHMKTERWQRAIEVCNKALQFDKQNVKVLFRKGSSYLKMRCLDEAEAVLQSVSKIAPDDAAIQTELHMVKQRQREAIEKQKRDLAGMFDRGKKQT